MARSPGTTDLIEQNHASAATLLKYHETYSEASLCSRSVVHQARHCVGPSLFERRQKKIKDAIVELQRKARTHVSARNLLYASLQAAPAIEAVQGRASFARSQAIMKESHAMYDVLQTGQKRKFEVAARLATEDKAKQCVMEQEALESHAELESSRATEERRVVGHHEPHRFLSLNAAGVGCDVRTLEPVGRR